jgi:hypothetical protein
MPRSYTLPVSAILQTLRDHNGITALSATLPCVPGSQQEAGQAVLILGQGRIHTCTIRARDGSPLVQGGEALKALERLGSLPWQVQGVRGNGEMGAMPGSTGSAHLWSYEQTPGQQVPRRLVARLSPEQQQALSRHHRQVFALVDGAHSVTTIARLLHLSPQEVAHLLHELQQQQLIDGLMDG